MNIVKTSISGLFIIEPEIFSDNRGYFFESYNQGKFMEKSMGFTPVQDNESRSEKNVIRGLHYQLQPMAQAKLIRVIKGVIFDVAVDIRKDSDTFGKWLGFELDSDSKKQLYIPRGFAHGFSVLSNEAIVLYKCDNFYNKSLERGISFKDPMLNIDWKIDQGMAVVSNKDINNPLLAEAEINT